MIGIPTLEDARDWVGVSEASVSDEDLQQILDAELEIQRRTLIVPVDDGDDEATFPAPLARSLLRRVQRQIAARNIPLGVVGGESNEWSPVGLQAWDAEVQRIEASYLRPVIA